MFLRAACICGASVTLQSMISNLVPIVDVARPWVFALKIGGTSDSDSPKLPLTRARFGSMADGSQSSSRESLLDRQVVDLPEWAPKFRPSGFGLGDR